MERDSCFSKGKDFSQQIRKAKLKSERGSVLPIFARVFNLFSQPKSGFLPEVGCQLFVALLLFLPRRLVVKSAGIFSRAGGFNKGNQLVTFGFAFIFAPAIVVHEFLHVATAFASEILAVTVDFLDDIFRIHGSSDFNSSADVQMTGQS